MIFQLYHRNFPAGNWGYFRNSWDRVGIFSKDEILDMIKDRKGNLRLIAKYIEETDVELFLVEGKWYGGRWSRYKVDISPVPDKVF